MKVAIDSGPLKTDDSVRGIGAHTRELITAIKDHLSRDSEISVDSFNFLTATPEKLSGYDILHYTSFHPHFISLPYKKLAPKVILTIHDLIPLIYPNHYAPGVKGKVRFLINKSLIKKNVDRIITISETSRKDICRFLGVSSSKVEVIYLAPPKEIIESKVSLGQCQLIIKKFNLPEKFVMYLGDVNYNKNIPTLVDACKIANIPLVVVGKHALDIEVGTGLDTLVGPMDYIRFLFGKSHPEVAHHEVLQDKFNKSQVLRLGYVSYKDLSALFKLASVYVQPSLYEGFGIPLVEAFFLGCPVVAGKTQALVEIGEGAALFANPMDSNDFSEKIINIMSDKTLRSQLIETGKVLVKKFTWAKTANETLEVYKNV